MIFMFVPRICCFETVCACMNLQHVGNNLIKRGIVDPWPLIDTVTGMKADLLLWNPVKTFINCFHEHGGTFMPCGSIQGRICKDVREEVILNLYPETCPNHRY